MNRFILGTVQFGLNYGINNQLGQPDRKTVNEIFNLAHKLGINTLDTAEAYGTAHEIIGNYHYNNNFEFNINTKFSSLKNETFIDQVKKACELLRVKKLNDCFYHSYAEYLHGTLKEEFQILIDLDLIDQVGVSIYTNDELEKVIEDPLVHVIQLPFNLFDNFHHRGNLILKAKNKGKKLQVRSIFLQGLFFLDPNSLKGNLVELKDDVLSLNQIVNEAQISMSDLCIQYALSFKEIDQIIIGVDTTSQLLSNYLSCQNNISVEIINRINTIKIKNTSLLYPYNWK